MRNETICEAFLRTAADHGSVTALRWRHNDSWLELSWAELSERVAHFAGVLRDHGVRPGNRVALLIGNRPEFHIADLAVLFCGATPISLYASSSAGQIADYCERANTVLTITEERFVELDCEPAEPVHLATAAMAVRPTDIATIIFTSGTTAKPKGVMLTHANVASMVNGFLDATNYPDTVGMRVLSYLPFAHIAERGMSYYLPVYGAMSVTTCPDPTSLPQYLPAVRPHLFLGVPRVWEKLHAVATRTIASKPAQRFVIETVLRSGSIGRKLGEPVLRRIREGLGLDEVRFAASAAAPLSPEIAEWFSAIGVPFSEVYGMSETCGPITWSPLDHRTGTVGVPLAGNEVRLLSDGEIVVRGTSLFAGYLDDPEATAAAFVDGWLCTGDIGRFQNGRLQIIDRKKDLIITGGGKNVSPAALQSKLEAHPLITHACVIGDRRPFISAVIVVEAAVDIQIARKAVVDHIAAINRTVSQPEKIKRHIIVDGSDWTPNSDVLTGTLKVRRRGVEARYADAINALYSRFEAKAA